MGIFNFLKNLDFEEKKEINKKNEGEERGININLDQGEIVVFDAFGREEKINRGKWINEVLNVRMKENWNNPELLATTILDAFSRKVYAETREGCLQLYSIDDNNERKINILSTYYTKIGKYNDAVELYERYLFRNQGTETIFLNYANVLSQFGKEEEVEKKYLEALKLNPNSKRAFNKYFKLLKEKNKEKYYKNLEELSVIEGMWRSKLLMAVDYFEVGDVEKGKFYLKKALEESDYDVDVMGFASGLYMMNEFYGEFENYVLSKFHPEKHGIYTILNVLEYYRIKGDYNRGLELCKYSSKYNWEKFFKNFLNYENIFINMKNKGENKNNKSESILLDKPLWYRELNEGKWILKDGTVKYNLLILPLVSMEGEEIKEDEISEKLSYGVPLYINELLNLTGEIESNLFVQNKGEKLIVPKIRYSREYMNLIKSKNSGLDYILSGNILKGRGTQGESHGENLRDEYNVEIYLFDFKEDRKITLINNCYGEGELYKIMEDVIFQLNGMFMLNIKSITDGNNTNLFLYGKKLEKVILGEEEKFFKCWEYKEMLQDQINVVLDDRRNEIKKINLIALIYEISKTNSQLLKGVKPILYNMLDHGFFDTYKLKLLVPIIFNVYNDGKNYDNYLEFLKGEIEKNGDFEYVDWLNKFLNYVE